MTDIVERLRRAVRDVRLARGQLYRDAADEIERLRLHAATLDGEAQDMVGEVARLRGLLREWLELGDPTEALEKRVREALGEHDSQRLPS